MPDHYTYPGTEVLVNRQGITDPDLWKATETAAVHQRMIQLRLHPVPGRFDLSHLQTIHRHLASDLYTWGGHIRDTDTGPGGTGIAHCRPEFILPESDRIFGMIRDRDYLHGRRRTAFSMELAEAWGETTALHPFRDLNTRSQSVFFNQLAEHAGWVIDWDRIDVRLFAHARTVAISRNADGLDALLHPALLSVEQAQRTDTVHNRLQTSMAEFFIGRGTPVPTPPELDAQLRHALERRRQALAASDDVGVGQPPHRDGPELSR